MASARGVQNFMQAIGKSGGISASNLYQFSFAKKPKLAKFFEDNLGQDFLKLTDNGDELNLQLLCNEIQLPGVTYSAFDVKSVHKGITQKMATAKVYNELDLSFFMDGTSLPLKFFRAWQDFTQNGSASNPEFFYDDQPYKRAFASNYYEDYACDMFISKLEKFKGSSPEKRDENGNVKEEDYFNPWNARLVHAYPYTVASIPYSAGAAQLVKVTVGFYYEYSHLMHSM
ncbi:hypothetical protein CPMG_00097 [Prochlorococcus phage MED4-213]|uniref:Uncharacterized protein n=1 Tax=Prochlorococcus phage MED4-213 TaxID=889956 RepID=M4QDH3_9CAUD|nr:hypothetical protein CPMG_00097 [Prochlorococcus phage MED4-213]AGH26198.1 hypothetical protein CPMG_00097 [Prochlorococcus phage MED4-213]